VKQVKLRVIVDGAEALMDARKFLDSIYDQVAANLKAMEKRIEKRIEERGALKYLGTFNMGTSYQKGDAITYGGSLWVALNPTNSKPPGPDWQLAAKRGRDAAR